MAFRRILALPLRFLVNPARVNYNNYNINVRFFLRASSTKSDQDMILLHAVISNLKALAPLSLAESWDNVGLLVEPLGPKFVKKVMLTNDLTVAVLEEAKDNAVDLIVSYHPPIFAPLKRLTQDAWKSRILIDCLESRIAVFSPHTSYDAVEDGVNDWLISAFNVDKESLSPIEATQLFVNNKSHVLEVDFEPSNLVDVWKTITAFVPSDSRMKKDRTCFSTHVIRTGSSEKWRLRLECSASELQQLMKGMVTCQTAEKYSVSPLSKAPESKCGMGRKAKLATPISLDKAVECVKSHLDLNHVSLAKIIKLKDSEDKMIETVAVCAGSGSSVLKNVTADLLVTGEMSHHQILDAVHGGSNVIVCHHSNSERGFLKLLQTRLSKLVDKSITVCISEEDRDPLEIV